MWPCSGRGDRSSRPKVISPEVISLETRVMAPEIFIDKSPEILIKSVCNISRSLSDNETKQAG